MDEEERTRYLNYGHNRVEAVFIDRVFIVYKPTGLTASKRHNSPEVLNLIKVIDFGVDPREGAYAVLKDQNTEQETTLTYVPKRIYGYPIFMSVPVKLQLKWDARMVSGRAWRSLSFAVMVKTKNRSDFFSKGNKYIATPSQMRRLFPELEGRFTV